MKIIALISFILWCLSPPAYAQRSDISKEEFARLYSAAWENTKKQVRREVYTYRASPDDETHLVVTSRNTIEIVPPDMSNFVHESCPPSGFSGGCLTERTVRIGEVEYRKTEYAGSRWAKSVISGKKNKTNLPLLVPILNASAGIKCYLTEKVNLEGKETTLLETEQERKFTVQDAKTKEYREVTATTRSKIWLDGNNLLVREELYSDGNVFSSTARLKVDLHIIEYDPNIKIEAPASEIPLENAGNPE